MKDKIGFNLVFALLAFPIGMALFNEFDFQSHTFENPALGILYLVTFVVTLYLMLKRKKKPSEM